MAKSPPIAASAAEIVFSNRPAALSCSPRGAIGRATSHSIAGMLRSGHHFKEGFDLHGRPEGQGRDADGRAGMRTLVAAHTDDEIRGAVHRGLLTRKIRCTVDEAAKPHATHDPIEIAHR